MLIAGNIKASRSLPEGEWKGAHPGYDYLDLIEKDKVKKKREHDRLNITPSIKGDDVGGTLSMEDSDIVSQSSSKCAIQLIIKIVHRFGP